MKKFFTLNLILFSALFLIQTIFIPSAFAAGKKVIIGFSAAPDLRDEDDIQSMGGKVKHRYRIIPAIAAEVDEAAIEGIRRNKRVDYVEMDQQLKIAENFPNDPDLSKLWGLHNTNGTDADIDAPEAWDIATGSNNVIIAVIDTGVDYNHPDLASNMWTNPGEIPGNGRDDDGNGYADDVHGYDIYNNDGDPMDDHSHGTHCAGTIAAVGNNGIGAVGVNWNARIMALKFLSDMGAGWTSDAILAVEYAAAMKQKGENIVATSNSWGGGTFSTSLYNAISASGMLFIAAAGNNGSDNDVTPFYPATYDLDNIISVAASDSGDKKASFSNYGATTVDLAAPGVSIYSTVPNNRYAYSSGTSMATPHVSGVVGLVAAQNPGISPIQIKNKILQSVDVKSSLAGLVTDGRLNAFKALNGAIVPPEPPAADFSGSPTSGSASLKVLFTDRSTGEVGSWSWAFGDGITSTAQNPSHTYINPGTYTVSLKVTNSGGSDDEIKANYITVNPSAPQTMYVSSINFSSKVAGKNIFLYTTVQVLDGNNNPLANVKVYITLTPEGSKSSSFTGTTSSNGSVIFTMKAKPGSYTATVTNLYFANYTWDELKGVNSSTFELLENGKIVPTANSAPTSAGFSLKQNVPNPFNPETWIPYTLPHQDHVIIKIFDVSGRMVRNLDLGQKSPGSYLGKDKAAYWDGTNESGEQVSSGIYFYIIEAGKFRASKRMLIIR